MRDTTKQDVKATVRTSRLAKTNAGLIEIQIHYRSIADLALDSRNPRHHSQHQINQIADSIREFGFITPVVVDHSSQVVIGHARILAAKKLDIDRVPVIEIRHLSKAQLKALRIADNRLALNAHWDERLLGESFMELKELDIEFDLSVTGFSLPEIDLSLQFLARPSFARRTMRSMRRPASRSATRATSGSSATIAFFAGTLHPLPPSTG